eukprot:11314119-Heterocapsa_arctica.AAC.1
MIVRRVRVIPERTQVPKDNSAAKRTRGRNLRAEGRSDGRHAPIPKVPLNLPTVPDFARPV